MSSPVLFRLSSGGKGVKEPDQRPTEGETGPSALLERAREDVSDEYVRRILPKELFTGLDGSVKSMEVLL
jgi:hypothetical protein